jgi:hypothetical protein
MTKPLLLFLFIMAMSWHGYSQTDSLATVHFYSFAPEQGIKKIFQIRQDDESLLTQEEGGEALLHISPGTYTFSLEPGTGNLPLSLYPGVTYFILCTSTGTFVSRTQSESESDLKKIRGN